MPLKVTLDPNIYLGGTLKIRPGATLAQASAELQPLFEQFAKQTPARYPDSFRVELRSITDLYAKPMGPTLYLLFGAVASLLIIGCANVSILLLARARNGSTNWRYARHSARHAAGSCGNCSPSRWRSPSPVEL